MLLTTVYNFYFIIRLEAMLRANTGPKNGVHTFGHNSAKNEPTWMKSGAGGWPWQILGAIPAVATVWEPAEFFFVFGQVSNARCH